MKSAFLLIALTFVFLAASVPGQKIDGPVPAFESLKSFPKIRDFTMTTDGSEAYFTVQSPLEEFTFIWRES